MGERRIGEPLLKGTEFLVMVTKTLEWAVTAA